MRRTQSLQQSVPVETFSSLYGSSEEDDIAASLPDLCQTANNRSRTQRLSIDCGRLPEASSHYQLALRDLELPPLEQHHQHKIDTRDEEELVTELADSDNGVKCQNPRFISRTAERICMKNFKLRYPKYMDSVVGRMEGISLSSRSSSPSLSSSPPPNTPNRQKRVTWGDVFTFDKIHTTHSSNPYLASSEPVLSPPRLRRTTSAKTRRNSKLH